MRSSSFLRLLLASLLLSTMFHADALAQGGAHLTINHVDDSAFPTLTVYYTATDATGLPIQKLGSEAFSVSEDGQSVKDFAVTAVENSDQPISVVLAIDTSGSMTGTPLKDTQQAAKAFAAALAPADQIGLVAFSDTVTKAVTLTKDKPSVSAAIDQLAAKGNTALYDAMVDSVDMLKNLPAGRKAIILLTDGENTRSKFTLDDAINNATRWSIPIYPIGFGNISKTTLEKIALLTGGYPQLKPDSSGLKQAFETVFKLLRQQYALKFSSSFPADGKEHPLIVAMTYQGAQVRGTHTFAARPGKVTVELTGLTEGQAVGGDVKLEIKVISPAAPASAEYKLDGKLLEKVVDKPFSYTWDSTAVKEGEHTLTASVTDAAGNTGTSQELRLRVRPPVKIAWKSPTDGGQVTGPGKLQVAVDALAGVAKVEYYLDGTLMKAVTRTPYDLDWTLDGVQPGKHTLRAIAFDINNKTSAASIEVTVALRQNWLILGLALAVVVAVAVLIVPIAVRGRRKLTGAGAARMSPVPGESLARASLQEIQGLQPGHEWALTGNELRIGRKRDDNDIPVAGLSASRQHAIIRPVEGHYVLFNLKPDNPTVINGQSIQDQWPLAPGDTIQIGNSTFQFQTHS